MKHEGSGVPNRIRNGGAISTISTHGRPISEKQRPQTSRNSARVVGKKDIYRTWTIRAVSRLLPVVSTAM